MKSADFNEITIGVAWDDDADTHVVTILDFWGDPLPADVCPSIGFLLASELLRDADEPQTR